MVLLVSDALAIHSAIHGADHNTPRLSNGARLPITVTAASIPVLLPAPFQRSGPNILSPPAPADAVVWGVDRVPFRMRRVLQVHRADRFKRCL